MRLARSSELHEGRLRRKQVATVKLGIFGHAGKKGRHAHTRETLALRGPAVILFISRDAAIVSQTSFVLVVMEGGVGTAQSSRDILKNRVSHRRACTKLSTKGGGGSQHFGEVLTPLQKCRATRGIAVTASQHRVVWGN